MSNEVYTESPNISAMVSTSVEPAFYEHGRIEPPWLSVAGTIPTYETTGFTQHWHANHPAYLLPHPTEGNCNFALYTNQVHVHAMPVPYPEHSSTAFYNIEYTAGIG